MHILAEIKVQDREGSSTWISREERVVVDLPVHPVHHIFHVLGPRAARCRRRLEQRSGARSEVLKTRWEAAAHLYRRHAHVANDAPDQAEFVVKVHSCRSTTQRRLVVYYIY